MNKLLLLSLEDYALTVLHFKDVLFNMLIREVREDLEGDVGL